MSEFKYTLTETGPEVRDFLDILLDLSGIDLTFEISEATRSEQEFETPDLIVRFFGDDVDLLLANKAELMLALEHLTMEMLDMPSEDHSRICFDANDYRMMRIEELRMSALAAAEKVQKTRVPFQFNPMNSRERRIIHMALRNETGVRSESIGMGPVRHVVIVPADMKTIPNLPPPAVPRPSGGGGGYGDRDRDRGPRRDGGGGGDRRGFDRRGPRRDGPPRRDGGGGGGGPRHGGGGGGGHRGGGGRP